jgi:hypothetical protein
MATGLAPFRAESAATIFEGILNQQPVPATRTNTRLPDRINGIIDKALEKDPELRYRTHPICERTCSACNGIQARLQGLFTNSVTGERCSSLPPWWGLHFY